MMKYDKQELFNLASQPSQKFDKEGVLVVKERQEGFFRRTESLFAEQVKKPSKEGKKDSLRSLRCVGISGKVSLERWCRLRGNLLFYMRGPEQWSEPIGVIVLEQFTITTQDQDEFGNWPFQIIWESGMFYKMAALTESDRREWLVALREASYDFVRKQVLRLQEKLESKQGTTNDVDIHMYRIQKRINLELNDVPLCEVSFSCDNLLCDAYGRPPSPLLLLHFKSPNGNWIRYFSTEVVHHSSNPIFSRTVCFRAVDGLTGNTQLKVTAYDMIERVSQTVVPMGFATLKLSTIQDTQRLRIGLIKDQQAIGFLTLNSWSLEMANQSSSPKHITSNNKLDVQGIYSHRRSHSLPPRLGIKLKLPNHGFMMKNNCANFHQVTYRFHSGLGGDITVHELMAESKLCFYLPQQLVGIYIQREKELLQEVICMGELGDHWKTRQMELIDTHLSLLKHYSQTRQCMQMHVQNSGGKYFKESSRKMDPNLEFAPVNLHIQRMWVHNDTLKQSGFYDTLTVGAFTAHSHKAGRNSGLIKLVQQLKENTKSPISIPSSTRVQMACDAVQAIKQIRNEVVNIMRKLLAMSKLKQSTGMLPLAEEIVVKTKILLSLWDPGLVEEALAFIEDNKVPQLVVNAEDLLSEPRRPQVLSPFKQLTEQLNMLDLKSPEIEDFATPSTPIQMSWPNEPQSIVDNNTLKPPPTRKTVKKDTNELEFYNEHFRVEANVYANLNEFHSLSFHKNETDHSQSSPIDQPLKSGDFNLIEQKRERSGSLQIRKSDLSPSRYKCNSQTNSLHSIRTSSNHSDQSDSLLFQMSLDDAASIDARTDERCHQLSETEIFEQTTNIDPVLKQFLDVNAMCSSPSANYYQPSDEPEPWDLTQLNIEASVMCLISKVKFLCGRMGSPAVRLRGPGLSNTSICSKNSSNRIIGNTDSISKDVINENDIEKTLGGSKIIDVDDIANKRKRGNKFTDGLKLDDVTDWAAELRPPMRKLRQAMDGLLKSGRLAHAVLRLRCFTSNNNRSAASLQLRRDTCFSQALTALSTALLTWLWSTNEDIIFQLMKTGLGPLVGFEGLLSLCRMEKAMWGDMVVAIEDLQTVMFTLTRTSHNGYLPQISGTRSNLIVSLPISDSLYNKFTDKVHLSFTVTAVFFNIGINEKVVITDTAPQEHSNSDNYERLNKYYNKYQKIFNVENNNTTKRSPHSRPLEEVMEMLKNSIQKKISKNVEVLHLAAQATRQMNGLRVTSCKSAKDRTGMSVTLEQCLILANEYHLAENEFGYALDCMRSEGCRRENTYKNTGVKKYAFNKVKIMMLPKLYRPPPGCYGNTQT